MKAGKSPGRLLVAAAATALLSGLNLMAAFGAPLAITDEPLFLNEVPPPLNMLVLSRDHRMYYEAYNDASDLDGDNVLDTTYKSAATFVYYGYFDSFRCYTYSAGVFTVSGSTVDKTCPGSWSGDWLNYVTMSRMDALRKVLYGGLRYVDTAGNTVLQRAYIPQDAHSWGKEYTSVAVNGYDITQYTPLPMPAAGRRHLIANTTPSGDAVVTGNANAAINGVAAPKMRVLESYNGRIWDWVSKERPVADASFAGGIVDYVVRVQVCAAGTFSTTDPRNNCKVYGSGNAKPTGLLQDYGENDSMFFGLLSGSYGKPHDGGVLRKAVGSLQNEIDLATGQFYYSLPRAGIINTIDRLRITNFNGDSYGCGWITDSSDAAGACSMWGNPTGEMMYEVARYYSGKGAPTGAFSSGANNWEETSIGLSVANWDNTTNPYSSFPRCSKPFETVISDISPSYDSDKVPGSAFTGYTGDIAMNAATLGQTIWTHELGGSRSVFIGDNGVVSNGAPTAKTVSSFGNIRGLSPEAPAKEGSYSSASVAYYALMNDLNPATGDQKMQTFGVALASPLPLIPIQVGQQQVTLVPFAKSVDGYGINATGSYQPTNQIVDFYVDTLTPTYGKFRVNFEDVEQGADHDMDAIAIYEYQVTGGNLEVRVTSEYAAGGIVQHMGYVISGVSATADGPYLVVRDVDTAANADPDYFLDVPDNQSLGGTWQDGQPLPAGTANPSIRTFTPVPGAVAAGILKDPLYYAAKWGGFDDSKGNRNGFADDAAEWDSDGNGVPDNYFLVTNALRLRQQLGQAFATILDRSGSASAASVSSGSINDSTNLYQAYFDARNWSGQLYAYPISDGDSDNDGDRDENDIAEGLLGPAIWNAAQQIPAPASRHILTVLPTPAGSTTGIYRTGVGFEWGSIGAARQVQLDRGDGFGQDRLAYLRGVRTNERPTGNFRMRTSLLGDIVNSAPIFVGAPAFDYKDAMATAAYSSFAASHANRGKTIYVGANDGMLHAFDALTGAERFAYIPHTVYRNLYRLTDPSYSHQFYVDGTPTVVDAFFASAWHTVLVSGLNKGGQSIFALDVTRPELIDEASANTTVLWEFTDAQDADLGYTYSRPAVVKMHDGRWVAVFGNGYNNTDTVGGLDTHVSTTGNAVLYIVDIQTGELVRKFDTRVGMAADPRGQSRPNGLATPALVDLDGDNTPDYIYAGDLFGNMWKFDVTDANAANWDIAYRVGGVPKPLFTAVNASGIAQPITERPAVRLGFGGIGAVVLFGTGKFLEAEDRDIGALSMQSFYGIFDRNTGTTGDMITDRSGLVRQTVVAEGTATIGGKSVNTRTTSNNVVDLAAQDGWYIDLVGMSGFQGEMQVTNPILRGGRVIFTTLIPDDDVCAYGGRSWLMEMNAMNGTKPTPFRQTTVNGIASDAIQSTPGIVSTETNDYLEVPNTNGETSTIARDPGPGALGRQSWRQLR